MKKKFKSILADAERLFSFTIIAASLTILSACNKTDFISNVLFSSGNITNITSGRVTDLNNLPVSNALVTVGMATTYTDNNGQFSIKNASLNKEFGFIRVSKPGYFPASRTFLIYTNPIKNIKIILLPKTISGKFSATSGGTINILGGGLVSFSTNSIVNAATGAVYSGNVFVSSFFLNTADPRFNDYMPGDLIGINSSNQQKILQSFGMISIELNDEAGEKLQLASGNTATIIFPIPASLQANAPADIPLWFFDETTGMWKEEGIATKQGNNYKGTVTHFSFWNCDLPAEYVKLELALKDQKDIPLANKLVTITSVTYGTRGSYTDSKGIVSGLIPLNESLLIKVYDQCGEIIYSNNIGPFSSDTNLGSIIVPSINPQLDITLSGNVVNCSNTPVTNGFVQVYSGNYYFNAAITNGNFVITFPYCSNSTNPPAIIAYDVGNGWQSSAQIINNLSSNQNIGQLNACFTTLASD
ncbi:MAG: carboxypeptidase regulatory-like domain-containing protein [Chitinophagaceae bacterium]|nr:MAG: carboxypeptidase regulatory-like domain-containing protein [Chitinophagaceae bacterium]